MLTRSEAHKTALSVHGTYEKPYFNKPSIFFGDHFVAVIHDKHEAVVLRVSSIEMRDMMLQAEPSFFYITDHYKCWPVLLVRLSALDKKTLKNLISGRIHQLSLRDSAKRTKTRPAKKLLKEITKKAALKKAKKS